VLARWYVVSAAKSLVLGSLLRVQGFVPIPVLGEFFSVILFFCSIAVVVVVVAPNVVYFYVLHCRKMRKTLQSTLQMGQQRTCCPHSVQQT
jgi:hypothetical protein